MTAATTTSTAPRMRIGLATFGPAQFAALHQVCTEAGHNPVVYVHCRSIKPRTPTEPRAAATAARIVEALPAGMDLLIPGTAGALAEALAGYQLDLLVGYGFSWRLPSTVLSTPRLGVINVHPSLLPRYRGPAPLLWAIRNGDTEIGLTIHRMDESFDTGRIIVQAGGVPLDDDVTAPRLWTRIEPVLRHLLAAALSLVAAGEPGRPQDGTGVSHAGFMEPEFSTVDWLSTARQVHNQVRVFRYMATGHGPVAQVDGRRLELLRTRLGPGPGVRVECCPARSHDGRRADADGDCGRIGHQGRARRGGRG